jgi:hypothetical protein
MTANRSPTIIRVHFQSEEESHWVEVVMRLATSSWKAIAAEMSSRTARQCHERWMHYLSTLDKDSRWTKADDSLLLEKIDEIGLRWNQLMRFLPSHTNIEVKRHWNLIFRRHQCQLRDSALRMRGLHSGLRGKKTKAGFNGE